MENNVGKNNKFGIVIFILVICIVALTTLLCLNVFGVIDLKVNKESNNSSSSNSSAPVNNNENKNSNSNNNNSTNNAASKEVTQSEKEEVTKIIGLITSGFQRLDSDTVESLELKKGDYIDINPFTIQNIFMNLDSGEYLTTDLSVNEKMSLIHNAAMAYNIKFETDKFEAQVGLSVSDYKKLANLYNFSEDGLTIFTNSMYKNGYYLFDVSGATLHACSIVDSISFTKSEDDIIVDYSAKVGDLDGKEIFNKSFKYTFKKNNDGSYYLYKIIVTKK